MEFNSDFKHDLKVGQVKEQELAHILNNKTIEVKYDKQAHITGNVFVEYESRNKPSGISITEADYYCFVIVENLHLIKTELLKEKLKKYWKNQILGGDSNTSKGILLPVNELI